MQAPRERFTFKRRDQVTPYLWSPKTAEGSNIQFHTDIREKGGIKERLEETP